jgi:hypothetical protein
MDEKTQELQKTEILLEYLKDGIEVSRAEKFSTGRLCPSGHG